MMNLRMASLAIGVVAVQARTHVFRAVQEATSADDGSQAQVTIVSTSEEATTITGGGGGAIPDDAITVPEYSDDQCSKWLEGVIAADSDGSGGLSEEEFHTFLDNIPEPSHIANFFDGEADSYLALPWMFKVVHKSLACRCVDLGLGNGCCLGDNAEIPFLGLKPGDEEKMSRIGRADVVAEYKADMCNSVAAVFEEAIPIPLPPPVIIATEAATTTTVAATIVAATEASVTTATATAAVVEATDPPAVVDEEEEVEEETEVEVETTEPLLEIDVVSSVVDYRTYTAGSDDEYYDAEDIRTNEDQNGILGEVIKSFGELANDLVAEMTASGGGGGKRNLRADAGEEEAIRALQQASMGQLAPVGVMDILCPADLPYAPEGGLCLNFNFRVMSGPSSSSSSPELSAETNDAYEATFKSAIDEGRMYDILIADYPETLVRGMGSPGDGIDYTVPLETVASSEAAAPAESEDDDASSGLGSAAIVGIVLLVIVVPMAILAMYSRYQKVQNEERLKRMAEYNAKQAERNGDLEEGGGGSIYSEPDQGGSMPVPRSISTPSAGSSLAAMGAAGAAATTMNMPKKSVKAVALEEEIRTLADETNAPKTGDELLAAYAGREEELVKHLRTMKAKNTTKAEVEELVNDVGSPKTSDELLAAYAGREDELVRNLRKMKTKKDQATQVRELVDSTKPGKTADELLTVYKGREDELTKNLRKMQSKQDSQREIEELVESTKPGKTADELLRAYSGREEELAKNLRKMKSKQDVKAEREREIMALVEETKPGKTAEELLASYKGREDELAKNLQKLKSKQERKSDSAKEVEPLVESTKPRADIAKEAGPLGESTEPRLDSMKEVESLVASTKPGKSAEELLAAYSGREDELAKNLKKLKARQDVEKVASLVASTNTGKTADELLEAYEGREDELITNLEKMKAKQTKTQVKSLVESTNPGKSTNELLEAYEGREDELIKNLEKMQAKQKKDRVKSLVESTNPGKSTKELLAAFEGREDELIKNLEKMQAKQEKQAAKATPPTAPAAASGVSDEYRSKVVSLVDETKPGKSAEDLLSAYQGRENELVSHLEKLKMSKRNLKP